MSRSEQIEALANAWESCSSKDRWVKKIGCKTSFVSTSYGADTFVAEMIDSVAVDYDLPSEDTTDATDCLAILRNVLGEDWDIRRFKDGEGVVRWEAQNIDLEIQEESMHNGTYFVSTLSRIDAVTKAVEGAL